MRIKQSIAFPIFGTDELPLGELCRNAAEIGYAAIEMWGRRGGGAAGDDDFDEVVATAREHGLRMVSTCGHGTLENGGNNPANHDRIVSELQTQETIDLAAASDVPNVIAFAGNRLDGQSDLEGMVECARVLRRVAPIAEDAGVNVNVELLNSRVDHPGYLGDHTDWGIALCEMVGSPPRQGAVRHLSHADHGGRRDPFHPARPSPRISFWLQSRSPRISPPPHRALPHGGQPRPPGPRRHPGAELPRHLSRDRRHRLRRLRTFDCAT